MSTPTIKMESIDDALRACKSSIRAMGAFSLLTNLLSLTPLFYMINVYDKAVATGSIPTLLALISLTLFLYLILGLMEWVRSMVLVHMANHLDKLLSQRFYRLVFEAESSFGSGPIGAQPLRDLNSLRQFLAGTTAAALFDLPWIPVFLVIMFFFHPILCLVAILCLVVMGCIAILNQRASTASMLEATQASGVIANQTQKNLRNAEVAAAMGMMGLLTTRWRAQQDKMIALQSKASAAASGYGATMKVMGMAVQSVAITTGAVLAMAQEISPGVIIGAALLLGKTIQPVQQVVASWRNVVDAYGQYQRLNELLVEYPESLPKVPLPPIQGTIQAQNATVVPPGSDTPNLTDINLKIPAGTSTMIIGPSAAGKSSLIRAILGVWPTFEGDFKIDGAAVSQYDSEDLGPQIGYLPQDIELFDGTIAQNIARFNELDSTKLFQATEDAGVHQMILELPEGYDTLIKSQQGLLSPGQRQRIALARALYGRPKILVLDEPNSNLDEAGEQALHRAIAVMKKLGGTIILVSHRHGALNLVDDLMVLESGRVTLHGPKEAVLNRIREIQSQRTPSLDTVRHSGEEEKLPQGATDEA